MHALCQLKQRSCTLPAVGTCLASLLPVSHRSSCSLHTLCAHAVASAPRETAMASSIQPQPALTLLWGYRWIKLHSIRWQMWSAMRTRGQGRLFCICTVTFCNVAPSTQIWPLMRTKRTPSFWRQIWPALKWQLGVQTVQSVFDHLWSTIWMPGRAWTL